MINYAYESEGACVRVCVLTEHNVSMFQCFMQNSRYENTRAQSSEKAWLP